MFYGTISFNNLFYFKLRIVQFYKKLLMNQLISPAPYYLSEVTHIYAILLLVLQITIQPVMPRLIYVDMIMILV